MEKSFKLNNEVQIPKIGFGTWKIQDGEAAINAIKIAVKNGYRHIDTAAIYANEKGIGIGIKECGIAREKLFITSQKSTVSGFKPEFPIFSI
jgi:diketogulonate reductase-like aldo/keto reductase